LASPRPRFVSSTWLKSQRGSPTPRPPPNGGWGRRARAEEYE